MAFDPFKRYYKINLVILVAGGLILGIAAHRGLSPARFSDRLVSLLPRPQRPPASAAPRGRLQQLHDQLVAARARAFELEEELAQVRDRLDNVLSSPSRARSGLRQVLPARVIQHRDGSSFRKSIRIDRGLDDGVREGMPVTCLGFLVGLTVMVSPGASWVQLIEDSRFEVEVRVGGVPGERPSPDELRQRPRGLFVGLGGLGGDGEIQQISAVREGVTIQVGALVTTAGSSTVADGLPVGLVSDVKYSGDGLFQEIRVRSALDLSWLDNVQVEFELGLTPWASARGGDAWRGK